MTQNFRADATERPLLSCWPSAVKYDNRGAPGWAIERLGLSKWAGH